MQQYHGQGEICYYVFFWTVHIGVSLRNAGLLVRVRQCLTYEGNVAGGDGHGHGDWLVQGQRYQAQQ